MPSRDGPLTLGVALLTRQRPQMLHQALGSWSRLQAPAGCTVHFLVVENDTREHVRTVVEEHRAQLPFGTLHYCREETPGIPFGRNRAAREALALGCDLLAFMDDDEVAARDWLVRLLEGYRQSRSVLLGGPFFPLPPEERLSFWQRRMFACLVAREKRRAKRSRARATLEDTGGRTVLTNNWLGETALFAEHGIWFDEEAGMTGADDVFFHRAVQAKGLPTGWVHEAKVYETTPAERLRFAYQRRRNRDQVNAQFHRRLERARGGVTARFLFELPFKALAVLFCALALPFTAARTLLPLARTVGWIEGRWGAVRGRHFTHYDRVTGA